MRWRATQQGAREVHVSPALPRSGMRFCHTVGKYPSQKSSCLKRINGSENKANNKNNHKTRHDCLEHQ